MVELIWTYRLQRTYRARHRYLFPYHGGTQNSTRYDRTRCVLLPAVHEYTLFRRQSGKVDSWRAETGWPGRAVRLATGRIVGRYRWE